MYKDLSHLNEEELDILIEKYYSGYNVRKILEEYNLDIKSSKLYTYFPPKVVPEYRCRHCNSYMIYNRKSKMYGDNYNIRDLFCQNCGHEYEDKYCQCYYCQREKKEILNYKKDIIKKRYNIENINSINFDNLNFFNKVYLGSIVRALISEDLSYIKDLNSSNIKLSPCDELTFRMYKELTKIQALVVSPFSDVSSFKDCEEFPSIYYIDQVMYILNINDDFNLDNIIKRIINPDYYNLENINDAYNLWKDIAINECIEYLIYQIKQINFEFNPADKTYNIIEIMLENFSVSQIYNIIDKSVKNASKFYLEKKVSKQHAANSIIGGCERYANRAIIEKWDLTRYKRNYDLPQSEISEFFFNKVIKIGNLGFDIFPNIELLRSKFSNND
ncbi:hypothetical protein [uncultured Brachyspira sp.]|uniref:hypothetical protein n=1 Tax=uncultured Brachyspira sp. TaxID=221953 RepID=UPI00260B6615|nr:hypothetical protein [uncultured Brachyspira sp.]